MKKKGSGPKDEAKTTNTEFESVKKILKKKELQTNILKKIIEENKLTDNINNK